MRTPKSCSKVTRCPSRLRRSRAKRGHDRPPRPVRLSTRLISGEAAAWCDPGMRLGGNGGDVLEVGAVVKDGSTVVLCDRCGDQVDDTRCPVMPTGGHPDLDVPGTLSDHLGDSQPNGPPVSPGITQRWRRGGTSRDGSTAGRLRKTRRCDSLPARLVRLVADLAGLRTAGSLGRCRLRGRGRFLPASARRIPPLGPHHRRVRANVGHVRCVTRMRRSPGVRGGG